MKHAIAVLILLFSTGALADHIEPAETGFTQFWCDNEQDMTGVIVSSKQEEFMEIIEKGTCFHRDIPVQVIFLEYKTTVIDPTLKIAVEVYQVGFTDGTMGFIGMPAALKKGVSI